MLVTDNPTNESVNRGTHPLSSEHIMLKVETTRCRPLVNGLQIFNLDDMQRRPDNSAVAGTLGGFVQLSDGTYGLLSNNHVIASLNNAVRGRDGIVQCDLSNPVTTQDVIAVLHDYVNLEWSPPEARPQNGDANLNEVDAGVARLLRGVKWESKYLPQRKVAPLSGTASPALGDEVFKVGYATGLTYGIVEEVNMAAVPIYYPPGVAWFTGSFSIRSLDDTPFSNAGDSGSLIVRTNGEVIGLLYGGNNELTYACPIDLVLQTLQCSLAVPSPATVLAQ